MPGLESATFLVSESQPLRLPPSAGEVAFVGRSNVGKSSLLNSLCRRDLAKVSSTPGRTRLINVYACGDRWLVDLPGYGFALAKPEERLGWGPMIESYLTGRESLRMVFALVDAKVGPTRLDLQMLDWLEARGLPWRAVAAKADQVKPSTAQARRRDAAHAMGLQPQDLAWVSARDGRGIAELRGEVSALLQR